MKNSSNIETVFKQGLRYIDYRNLVDRLILEGKTTGNKQTGELVDYTKLNVQRMNRLDKTILLPEEIQHQINKNKASMYWLLVGDAWCGDCAQIIPVINKMAEANRANISLRIISRDSYPGFLEDHSNGSRAIPKLLIIDPNSMKVIGSWGSRPEPAMEIAHRWKESNGKISNEEFQKELQLWYTKDKGAAIIKELVALINTCERKITSKEHFNV